MTDNLAALQSDRRNRVRFLANLPLTISVGDRTIPGYTHDISEKGVYFYLGSSDSELIVDEFEFTLQLPPDVTLSTWCSIHCRARLARKETKSPDLAGIAAEILDYSVVGDSVRN